MSRSIWCNIFLHILLTKYNQLKMTDTKNQNQKKSEDKNIQIPTYIAIESSVGAALLLAGKSSSHKYLFASDFESAIIPAVLLKQFFLFRNDKNEPVAFVSFANVSEEVEKRLLEGTTKLKPGEWKSGDKLYLIDLISPFAPATEVLKQLNENQFKDKEVNVLRPKKEGKGFESNLLKDLIVKK